MNYCVSSDVKGHPLCVIASVLVTVIYLMDTVVAFNRFVEVLTVQNRNLTGE